MAHASLNNHRLALENFLEAYRIFNVRKKEISKIDLIKTSNCLGATYKILKDKVNSLKYYNEADELEKELMSSVSNEENLSKKPHKKPKSASSVCSIQ